MQHHGEPPHACTLQSAAALTHLGVHMVTPIPWPSISGGKKKNVFTEHQPVTLGFSIFGVQGDL